MINPKAVLVMTIAVALSALAPGSFSADDGLFLNIDLLHVNPGTGLDHRYGSEFGVGLSVEYMYNEYFGMNASGRYFALTRDNREDADFRIGSISLNGLAAYPFLEKWRVFCIAGMGLHIWQAENSWWIDGLAEESVDMGWNIGGGMSYALWSNIEIISKISRNHVRFEGRDCTSGWLEITLGARFSL
ncbi:outer membrane beta-barrel protein [bacterium]|nr:outer membrane beta-barrel protein [candidate division CSSED10-310 bacterium]